jgi:hypothetical protein
MTKRNYFSSIQIGACLLVLIGSVGECFEQTASGGYQVAPSGLKIE